MTPNTWGRDRTGDLAIMSGALSPSELPRQEIGGRSAKGGAKTATPAVTACVVTASPDLPGIMRNGEAPRTPALPYCTTGTARHAAAPMCATDSAKDSAALTVEDVRLHARRAARLRRALRRLARWWPADLTTALDHVVGSLVVVLASDTRAGGALWI